MVIKRVRLKNFKAHANFDREFGKFTIILGRNNAGKSTILEAIYKALYSDSEDFGTIYIRRGEKGFVINIQFSDGYEVEVAYPKTKTAKVYGNNGILTLKEFRRVFKFPEDDETFKFLVMFEQGSLDEFKRETYEKVKKILKLDFADNIIKAADKVIRDLNNVMKRAEGKIQPGIFHAKKVLRNLKLELEECRCGIKRLERFSKRIQREIDELERQRDEIRREIEVLEKLKGERERMTGMLEVLKKRKGEIERKILEFERSFPQNLPKDREMLKAISEYIKNAKTFKENLEKAKEYEKLKGEYENIKNDYMGKTQDLGKTIEYLRGFYSDLKRVVEILIGIPENFIGKTLEELNAEKENLKAERDKVVSEIGHFKKRLESLKDAGDRCPVCGEPLPSEKRDKLIKESHQALMELYERERHIGDTIKALEKNIQKLNELSVHLKALEDKLPECPESLKDKVKIWVANTLKDPKKVLKDVEELGKGLRAGLEELERDFKVKQGEYERRLKELERPYAICLASKENLERITKMYPNIEDISGSLDEKTVEENLGKLEEYGRNKGEIEKIVKELEKIQKAFEGEEFKDLDKRLNNAKEVLKEIEERIDGLRAERERIINGIRNLEGKIYEKQPKYEELKKIVREFEDAKEGIERVSRFKSAVEEAKKTFISLAKLEFEKALNTYFLDRFGFSNRYTKIEVDENFEPVFHTREGSVISRGNSNSLSVNKVGLSGGERTALGLAYRLALRELFGDVPKVLLLDEPTTHMDADRRLAVWGILKEIAERDNIQIIAVTHDDAVEDVVERENIIRLAS